MSVSAIRRVAITDDRMKIYMVCPITQGDHKIRNHRTKIMSASATQGGHKEEDSKKKPQDENIMAFPIP